MIALDTGSAIVGPARADIFFGSGISREGCLIDMGAQSGVLEKSGAWYLYKGEKLGQGRGSHTSSHRNWCTPVSQPSA